MIHKFIKAYGVDMSEAANTDPTSYANFNAFFTRQLGLGVRHLDKPIGTYISPADGVISEFGNIQNGQLLQAKGDYYSLDALLADTQLAKQFAGGSFMTIYLSPKDYHRVHMPTTGTLKSMYYVPGKLFSVNADAVAGVPGLFARNERAVCLFETERGPMAIILVGAMIVASIHTVWAGQVAPTRQSRKVQRLEYTDQQITLKRGAEMGHFQMGSTAIVVFAEDAINFSNTLKVGAEIHLGDELGI